MGVDLTLLPLLSRVPSNGYWVSHQIIQLQRDYDLWDRIKTLPQENIPEPLTCYLASGEDGESRYGQRSETPYGTPITHLTAGDLLKLDLSADSGWQNKAAWAYLMQMPPDWPICLYWH